MTVHVFYRLKCSGPCRRWLRNGRAAPGHWGPMYAESFDSETDADSAAEAAGWHGQMCPACRAKEEVNGHA